LNKEHEHATFAINKFADLTPREFRETRLMPDGLARHRRLSSLMETVEVLNTDAMDSDLPATFDW
jgi:hypothetical protein